MKSAVSRSVLVAALAGSLVLPLSACGSSSVKVPDGFPTSAVPLLSTSLSAAERSGDAWNLTVDGHADQISDALKKLKDAGFTVVGQSTSDAGPTYSLWSADYSVRLGVSADGKSLTYGVVAQGDAAKVSPSPEPSPSPSPAP